MFGSLRGGTPLRNPLHPPQRIAHPTRGGDPVKTGRQLAERQAMRSDTCMRRSARRLAVLALAATCACSGDEGAEPSSQEAPAVPPEAAAAANGAPVVRSVRFDPEIPLPGQRVTTEVDARDPDGDPVRLVYTWLLDGRDTRRSDAGFDVPQEAKGSMLEVNVVAHDGKTESQPHVLDAVVGNQPPELVDLLVEPAKSVTVEHEIVASARAVDPDGDPVEFRYTWLVNGRHVEVHEPVLTQRHFARDDTVQVEVVVSDGEDETDPLRSPPITIQNSLPVITSTPQGLDGDGAFRYQPEVTDADGDRRLRFRLVEAPEGMTIDWLRGTVSWRPREDQAGKHHVDLEVDDSAGGVHTQSFVLDVQFEDPDPEPTPAAPAP